MFYDIGVSPVISASMIVLFSEQICLMYSRKKCTNVDNARLEIFLQRNKTNTNNFCEKVTWQHASTVLTCPVAKKLKEPNL